MTFHALFRKHRHAGVRGIKVLHISLIFEMPRNNPNIRWRGIVLSVGFACSWCISCKAACWMGLDGLTSRLALHRALPSSPWAMWSSSRRLRQSRSARLWVGDRWYAVWARRRHHSNGSRGHRAAARLVRTRPPHKQPIAPGCSCVTQPPAFLVGFALSICGRLPLLKWIHRRND